MKSALLAALGILASGRSEDGVARLVATLSPEGLSGKVAMAGRTQAGRRAIREALEQAVEGKTLGFDGDLDAVATFTRRCLVASGDRFAWKPERADRAERILSRTLEILREEVDAAETAPEEPRTDS